MAYSILPELGHSKIIQTHPSPTTTNGKRHRSQYRSQLVVGMLFFFQKSRQHLGPLKKLGSRNLAFP